MHRITASESRKLLEEIFLMILFQIEMCILWN